MIIDRGHDFPEHIQQALDAYGPEMWLYRDDPSRGTTRALNAYRGEHRGSVRRALAGIVQPADCALSLRFEYHTPRLRLTPRDLLGSKLSRPKILHFICSPSRAAAIMSEVKGVEDWHPTTVYEPIPVRSST